MPIFYKDVIQGTPQWAELRCGVPTASNFSRIITPKGALSKQAEGYMHELLAERMSHIPTVPYTSHWMDRGSNLESEAVSFYEFQRDCETEKVGFVLNDEKTVGASPDRLVGSDGLLEIKCPSPGVHVSYLLKRAVDADYYPQVMGQLWICQKEWNDIMSYSPALPPALIRVERDEAFIEKLAAAVMAFVDELEKQYKVVLDCGWVRTPEEVVTSELEESIAILKRSLASAASHSDSGGSGSAGATA